MTPQHLLSLLQPHISAPRWWVAFSGGLDSTVLLSLLAAARALDSDLPELRAIHVNHGLQAEADSWAGHCQRFCQPLNIPLEVVSASVTCDGKGLEAAARRARYRVFEACLGEGEVLLSAHHQDDQVETLLLRLLRGAGPDGLGAMPAERALGRGRLVRPLLDVPRAVLQDYVQQQGLKYIDDPSNADTALDRNFLRHDILPRIARRWPGYRATLSRSASHMRDAARDLDAAVAEVRRCQSVMGDPGLVLVDLLALSDSLAGRALRCWLIELGQPQAPDAASVMELLRQLRSKSSAGARFRVGALALGQFRDGLYALPELDEFRPPDDVPVTPGQVLELSGLGELWLDNVTTGGLRLAPQDALHWRWRAGGERCHLPGRAGSRSLKNLLHEAAVPPWWRQRVPLLYCGDELLAVGDLWLCDSSRLQANGSAWQVRWQRKSFLPRD